MTLQRSEQVLAVPAWTPSPAVGGAPDPAHRGGARRDPLPGPLAARGGIGAGAAALEGSCRGPQGGAGLCTQAAPGLEGAALARLSEG